MHLVLFTLTEREKAVDLFFSRNLLKQEPGEKRKLKPPLALSLSLSLSLYLVNGKIPLEYSSI
jgi:hypothetical protein